jgi:16S rRNA (cytidine1402-2'-O)-methyltransferase
MSSDRRGSLYLLPNTLGDVAPEAVIPAAALDRARSLDYIIAEDPKAARAFLKRIAPTRPLQSIRVERLDHNTREAIYRLSWSRSSPAAMRDSSPKQGCRLSPIRERAWCDLRTRRAYASCP